MARGPKGKGGKKAAATSKKRKSSNVWDDAEPKKKRGTSRFDDNGEEREATSTKRTPGSSSMFAQWKTQKQGKRALQNKFASSVASKKSEQREEYLSKRQQLAEALYEGNAQQTKRKNGGWKQQEAAVLSEQEDSEQEEEDDSDDETVRRRSRKSVFDQFVQTFQPAAPVAVTDDEEEDEEEELEYVEEEDEGDEPEDEQMSGAEGVEQDVEEEGSAEEQEDDEPEDANDPEASDDANLVDQQDPYRQRYLLTSFSEEDAKTMTADPRKNVALALEDAQGNALPLSSEFQVSYRAGSSALTSSTPASALHKTPLYIRSRLLESWKRKELIAPETLENMPSPSLEACLLRQLQSYADVCFAAQTYENTNDLRRVTAMHVLNHIYKARDTVNRNNERLKRRLQREEQNEPKENEEDDDEKDYRDQGFCRASVLVLLPLRSSAYAFVKQLLELLPSNVDTFHKQDRFEDEYGNDDGEDDEEKEEDMKEWQKVFAQGNNDDSFQLGLSFARKSVRFYSEYHQSDLIIASPLGLRQQLGDEVVELDDAELAQDVKLSTDFLSSIEVCVVDSVSLMLMQNVDHLRHVLQAVNVQPKEAPNADFARVREWNLSFLGSYFRQNIVLAHGLDPALNHLVRTCSRNWRGVLTYVRKHDAALGTCSITRVVPQIKQIFQRIDLHRENALAGSLRAAEEVELRFAYFQKHIFEPLLDHPKKHVLIFIPSYLDYVRVRNLFHETTNKKLIRSVQACEYTTNAQLSRARTSFFHGKAHVMLATERFHFYHQYHLRGIHQLIWYGLPAMGEFYPEMLNMLGDSATGNDAQSEEEALRAGGMEAKSSIALFTRLDLLRLQRIVGDARAQRMCHPKAKKATFLFC